MRSIRAEPGKTLSVPVRVTRGKGLEGAVRVELVVPGHVRGVSAQPITIPTDQAKGELAVRFDAGRPGPFNAPLTIRATLSSKTGPITAEWHLEVAP